MTHPANRWWLLLLWLWAALAFATLPPNVVRIHYHRTAGDYDGWGLHVWGDGLRLSEQVTWRKPLMPAGRTEHGIYFDLPVSPSADKIGFLLHRGEVKNTNRDMWLFISRHGREIWQLQDDDRIYPSPPPPFIRHSAPNFENTLCDECRVTERPINNFLTPMVSCISVARLSCQGMTRSQMS